MGPPSMSSSGRFVDLGEWKRGSHARLFRGFRQPFFSVTVELDATRLRERSLERGGPPFFLASLYLMLRAANETEAMRVRLRDEGVWIHDRVKVSSTILRPDETFGFARIAPAEWPAFAAAGAAEVDRAKSAAGPLDEEPGDDLVYHSTLPWIRFTSFSNALPLEGDSIPRIVFGRCVRDGGAWRMPVAVEVHHAIADGLDVARFLERLQRGFDAADALGG